MCASVPVRVTQNKKLQMGIMGEGDEQTKKSLEDSNSFAVRWKKDFSSAFCSSQGEKEDNRFKG